MPPYPKAGIESAVSQEEKETRHSIWGMEKAVIVRFGLGMILFLFGISFKLTGALELGIFLVAYFLVCFLVMIRRPPRSTRVRSSAASDVYKRQVSSEAMRRESSCRYRKDSRR